MRVPFVSCRGEMESRSAFFRSRVCVCEKVVVKEVTEYKKQNKHVRHGNDSHQAPRYQET
jgi:hypothetical protein